MERQQQLIAALCIAAVAWPAGARDLKCHRDRVTDAVHCIDADQVRAREQLRLAPLYRGGPDMVRPTSVRLAVDCATGTARLVDEDGVSFGAGPVSSTAALAELSRAVCAAKINKR